MEAAKPRLITREFLLISVTNFLISFHFFSLMTTMPRYAIEQFGLQETLAGLASGLFIAGMMVSRILAGHFVTRTGFKPMLLFGLLGVVIFSIGYFFADTAETLFIVRILNGFFYGIAANTCITIVSTIIPRERIGEGVGYYSVFQMVSWAAGPYCGVALSDTGNYTTLFFLAILLPGIVLALLPFMRLPGTSPVVKTDPETRYGIYKYIERSAISPAISNFLMMLFFGATTSFAAVYGKEIGLDEISSFFIIFPIALIATRPLVSRVFDRHGANMIVYPGCIISALSYILFGRIDSIVTLIVVSALFGIGIGAVQNTMIALVVKRSPLDRMGVANATFYMFLDCSAASGPVIGGALIELSGYAATFFIGGCITLVGLIYYAQILAKNQTGLRR